MLQSRLRSIGPVSKAHLTEDGEEGVKRGIVTYELKEDAQAAIDQLNETNFEVLIRNRPNQEILVPDWLINSHVT